VKREVARLLCSGEVSKSNKQGPQHTKLAQHSELPFKYSTENGKQGTENWFQKRRTGVVRERRSSEAAPWDAHRQKDAGSIFRDAVF
jgi:hypothetical protein